MYRSERHDRKKLGGTARHDCCRSDVCSANGELRNLDRTSSSSQVIGMRLKEKRLVLVPGYEFSEETRVSRHYSGSHIGSSVLHR